MWAFSLRFASKFFQSCINVQRDEKLKTKTLQQLSRVAYFLVLFITSVTKCSKLLAPIVLRRLKVNVDLSLPAKQEVKVSVEIFVVLFVWLFGLHFCYNYFDILINIRILSSSL
jgi:hypothetical protein